MKTGVQQWAPVFFCPNNTSGDLKALHGNQIRVIYYFDDSGSLRALSRDEVRLKAKDRYAEWNDGYRVEIADITASWGEGRLTD